MKDNALITSEHCLPGNMVEEAELGVAHIISRLIREEPKDTGKNNGCNTYYEGKRSSMFRR